MILALAIALIPFALVVIICRVDMQQEKAADFHRYWDLNAKMDEMRREFGPGAIGLDDFQSLWRELEQIKNRHGGMPPSIQ